MIPLPEIHEIRLFGLIPLQPFGLLLATGVFLGYLWGHRMAKRMGIPEEEVDYSATAVVLTGFIGAHWFDAIFYHWDRVVREGIPFLLKMWDGISSYGGFFGAIVGFMIFARGIWKKGRSVLPHADILVSGLVVGWIFGRFGCTIVGDHPGNFTDSPLGFRFPDGVRHNLGFYEWLYTVFVLFPVIPLLQRLNGGRGPRAGTYTAVIVLLYAPVRFFLDFFRATELEGGDNRFFGLTPGHYASIIALAIGLLVWRQSKKLDFIPSPTGAGPAKKKKPKK